MHFRPVQAGASDTVSAERGSVLMVALILAAVIAISLTSFLSLTKNTAKLANRSFYMDGAQNLCDLGVEQALWCMNNSSAWTTGGFALQSGSTNKYVATFPTASTYYTFSGGVKGQVKIWADMSTANIPHVVVLSTMTLIDGSTLTKEAEAYMKIGSYFDNGMVGNTITFKGGVTVDSWNSDPNGNGSLIQPYTAANAHDKGEVGATSIQTSALSTSQGQIEGYASVGSSSSSGISLGSHGSIGDYSWVNGGSTGVQTGHATYDFTESFPDVTAPTAPSGATTYALTITGNVTLPRVGDVAASDGKYYYNATNFSLSGNNDLLTITGNVVMSAGNVTASGNNGGVVIATTGSLALYSSGDVSITGGGIMNGSSTTVATANQPIKFQLYGTRSATAAATSGEQSISIKGNGYLSGVVYAPNANVTVTGNGDVLGAVVGGTVTMDGTNTAFHYDESLANAGVAGIWKIRKWRELANPSEQATYASNFTF